MWLSGCKEQVSLREEHIEVERRPASGTTQAGTISGDPFQEPTIEVEERSEEAVVSKEARVVEEVVVRKDVEQRTETVSDTVRHRSGCRGRAERPRHLHHRLTDGKR